MAHSNVSEGPTFVRFVLVWSSLGPVFLLWALRGVNVVEDSIWVPLCLALFAVPTLLLWLIFRRVHKTQNTKTIELVSASDQREHLLTYLFAVLIPLFDFNLDTTRDLAAVMVAMMFVIFLFWYMRLHYVNLLFAAFRYRIYTVEALSGTGNAQGSQPATYVVLSRQGHLSKGTVLTGYRLGGNVLADVRDA